MKLDDLRNIDFNNIGSLPLPVKGVVLLALLILLVGAGGWFIWKPMLDELQTAQDEEWGPNKTGGLRATYESKLAIAANLEQYKQQLKEAELKTNVLLQQLPDKSQMDGLLTDINQAGIGRGLEFELFKPGAEKPSALYAEMPISIRVQGNYHDLGAFAADLGQMSRIVTLSNVVITPVAVPKAAGAAKQQPTAQNAPRLNMDATATTFRALDKSEVPAPAKKKPGKKGKKG
jgi:type IV pilus assembly protein PilO